MSKWYSEACAKMPLRALITHYGHVPPNGNWKSFPECPFCHKRGGAGVFVKGQTEFFKCQHKTCDANQAVTQIGYIHLKEGLSTDNPTDAAGKKRPSPACLRFYELAGVRWEDPAEKEATLLTLVTRFLAESAWEKVSAVLIQRTFKLSYAKACGVLDELVKRNLIGPGDATGDHRVAPRVANEKLKIQREKLPGGEGVKATSGGLVPVAEALKDAADDLLAKRVAKAVVGALDATGDPAAAAAVIADSKLSDAQTGTPDSGLTEEPLDEALLAQCVDVIRSEQKASASLLQRRLRLSYGLAARLLDELEDRGIVGPSKGAEPREVLLNEKLEGQREKLPSPEGAEQPASAPNTLTEIRTEKTRERFRALAPAAAPSAPDNVIAMPGVVAAPPSSIPNPQPSPQPDHSVPLGLRALREFYGLLNWSVGDQAKMFTKRVLTAWTCARLGLRSNPPGNAKHIEGLRSRYALNTLVESGLMYTPKGQRRPVINNQYAGVGNAGKIKTRDEYGDEKKATKWEQTEPVLIPYLDYRGELIGLRPHKGGPKSSGVVRPRLYVPRCAEWLQTGRREGPFDLVMITEGELKAAVFWQFCGAGREQFLLSGIGQTVGVAALPGISMSRNAEIEHDLFEWLHAVAARRVVVVFDNEEKGDPRLPGYNEKPEERHDALVYAQYLALAIPREFPAIDCRVGTLPPEWRDEKGKADWDGAASRFAQGKMAIEK